MKPARSLVLSLVAALAADLGAAGVALPAYAAGATASFVKTADWGSGWEGKYTITNGGSSTINGWSLAFDLPSGTTLGSYWDALLSSIRPAAHLHQPVLERHHRPGRVGLLRLPGQRLRLTERLPAQRRGLRRRHPTHHAAAHHARPPPPRRPRPPRRRPTRPPVGCRSTCSPVTGTTSTTPPSSCGYATSPPSTTWSRSPSPRPPRRPARSPSASTPGWPPRSAATPTRTSPPTSAPCTAGASG